MLDESEIELAAGHLRLRLSPATGGAISAFEWRDEESGWPILRASPHPLEQVLDAACFPLVPYVNRIRGGRFDFRGREVRLAPNMAGDASPLHGQGWLNRWSVVEASRHRAVLAFAHAAGEWPWSYRAVQSFDLDEGGLSIQLTCQNLSPEAMPCGLGFHPYFPCGPHTVLKTQVDRAWTVDDHVLPVDEVPATGHYDLRDRRICGQNLDNGFGGWAGDAHVADPDWPYTVAMRSPGTRFFQVYSPISGGIFVAEPVTHANAALNQPEAAWPGLGLRVMEPDETMSLAMRLDVISK